MARITTISFVKRIGLLHQNFANTVEGGPWSDLALRMGLVPETGQHSDGITPSGLPEAAGIPQNHKIS